jgi:hypothetical protein
MGCSQGLPKYGFDKCHHTPKSNKISLIISRISGYEENSRVAKKGTI